MGQQMSGSESIFLASNYCLPTARRSHYLNLAGPGDIVIYCTGSSGYHRRVMLPLALI